MENESYNLFGSKNDGTKVNNTGVLPKRLKTENTVDLVSLLDADSEIFSQISDLNFTAGIPKSVTEIKKDSGTQARKLDTDKETFSQIPDVPSFTDKKHEAVAEINANLINPTKNRKTMHKLWITDLLNTVRNINDNFFFENQKIDMVMSTGIVTDIKIYPERIRFVLDDGTGTIECFHKTNKKYKSFLVNFLTSGRSLEESSINNSSILDRSFNCIFDETNDTISNNVNDTVVQRSVNKISNASEDVKNWFYEHFSNKSILNYEGKIMHVVGFLVKKKDFPSIQVVKMRPVLNFNDEIDYRMEVCYYYKHIYKK